MRYRLFLISLALSSAACSGNGEEAHTVVSEARSSASASAEVSRSGKEADAAEAFSFDETASKDGGTREFAYSWPSAVGAVPELVERFTAEKDRLLAEQKSEWEEMLADHPEGCVSCISRGFEKEWKVVADLPRWLSLSADIYSYTGGAHGGSTRTSLIWDRQAERALEGVEMFNSPVELETALGPRLCDALDAMRARKRGVPVQRSDEWSTDCPGINEATVLVGSSNGETFDRIGIYFGPYVAGAYAEGAYELDFPVTASIVDAVKPEYAKAFSVKR